MSGTELPRHEFRNHLTIILGYSELLLKSMPREDPRHADLEEIEAAARASLEMLSKIFPRDADVKP